MAISSSIDPSIPITESTLLDAWWDSGRPDMPDDHHQLPSSACGAALVPLASSHRAAHRQEHHQQRQGLLWQSFDLPPGELPAVLLESERCVMCELTQNC